MMIGGDNNGQMIFGDHGGLKLPDISYRWGKIPKKPHPGNLSRSGIEPRPAAWQARMLLPVPQRDILNSYVCHWDQGICLRSGKEKRHKAKNCGSNLPDAPWTWNMNCSKEDWLLCNFTLACSKDHISLSESTIMLFQTGSLPFLYFSS